MTNNIILLKIAFIHAIAIVLVIFLAFSSGYPLLSTWGILTAICAPLVAYIYIYLRTELRHKKTNNKKKANHFIWSLYIWLGIFMVLLFLKWGPVHNLSMEEFNSFMDPLNSAKLFFFSWYIPIFFPESAEKNEI